MILEFKTYIIQITMIFIEKIKQVIHSDLFLSKAGLLTRIVEVEVEYLTQTKGQLRKEYTDFLFFEFIRFLNSYTENFLENLFLMLCENENSGQGQNPEER